MGNGYMRVCVCVCVCVRVNSALIVCVHWLKQGRVFAAAGFLSHLILLAFRLFLFFLYWVSLKTLQETSQFASWLGRPSIEPGF